MIGFVQTVNRPLTGQGGTHARLHIVRWLAQVNIGFGRRDKFITGRIAETLGQNETGILFIGAYHHIMKRLPKDIIVIELKEISKIRKYQRAIQSDSKNKTRQLEQLTEYMVQK